MKGKGLKYAVTVAILAAILQATPTFASPVTQGQINATQGKVAQTQGQIDDLETKIEQLDNQITVGMANSQKLDDDIKAQQGQIEKTKVKIEKAKEDLENHKNVYSERLRSIQAQGQQPIITYAELLLSSKNISEFLTRSTAIMQFLQSDTDLMNALIQKEQALNNAEQQLHNELDNLKKSQEELASEQKKIQAAKLEVDKELAASKNNLQQQQSQLAQQKAQQKAQQLAAQKARQLAQQLARQRAQQLAQQRAQQLALANAQQHSQQQAQPQSSANNTPSAGGAGVTASENANLVIATAEQFLGVPYVWGGTTPSGFDCSGLMQYVFHSVGVNLPRVASDQQNVGVRISPSQVQPGDLVFMGDPAYHVGMYIGGGKWIQAPHTGDVVKISPYNPASFSSAARVLN